MAHFYQKITLVLKSESSRSMFPDDSIQEIFSDNPHGVSLLEIVDVESFPDPFRTQEEDSRSVGEQLLALNIRGENEA